MTDREQIRDTFDGASAPDRDGWLPGPPPGRGRYWVVWRGWPETRVEAVELSPALIYRDSPTAPLQIKTLSGMAYQWLPNRDDITHHMPLVAP